MDTRHIWGRLKAEIFLWYNWVELSIEQPFHFICRYVLQFCARKHNICQMGNRRLIRVLHQEIHLLCIISNFSVRWCKNQNWKFSFSFTFFPSAPQIEIKMYPKRLLGDFAMNFKLIFKTVRIEKNLVWLIEFGLSCLLLFS